MNQDHYEALQVHPRADAAAIDAAYARLRERYDPANLEGAADELLELARARRDAIERAYAVLRDPTLRERYDAEQRQVSASKEKEPENKSSDEPRGSRFSVLGSSDAPLDYRPLPPARRQERAKGAAEPSLAPTAPGRAAPAKPAGRMAQRLTLPVTLGAVLALIITASLFVTGGGGPPAPAPTPTVSQFDVYESSIPQAQAFAEQNPASAQAWIDLGNVLYDSAQIVREQAPESPVYQQRMGRWLQATNAYSEALALEPDNAPARADMGASSCFYGAGTGDQSFVRQGLAEVERAASAAPDDARVLLSMGHCLVSTAPPQTDEAIKTWQRIIDRNPSSPLVGQAQLLIAKYKR